MNPYWRILFGLICSISVASAAFGQSISNAPGVASITAGTGLSGGTIGPGNTGTISLISPVPESLGGTGLNALGTGVKTWLGTPSSANLRSALTDETGTGALFFQGGNIGAATGTSLSVTGALVPGTPMGIGVGGTNQATAAGARGPSGLNVESVHPTGDANVTIAATTRTEQTTTTLTAPRAWTLPAANAVNAGQSLVISDAAGAINGANVITLTRAGSDTINGATTYQLSIQYQQITLVSDGVSKWTTNAASTTASVGNNTLMGNISGGPAPAGAINLASAGASLVLLQATDLAGLSSVTFTTGITSAYASYEIIIVDTVPTTDSVALRMRISQDGGSTWKSGASDYQWVRAGSYTGSSAYTGSNSAADSAIAIIDGSILDNNVGRAVSGTIRIGNLSGTKIKNVKSSLQFMSSHLGGTYLAQWESAGAYTSDGNAINGLQIFPSSGTFASGKALLYGYRPN